MALVRAEGYKKGCFKPFAQIQDVYKASIVGIDGAGKTSAVAALHRRGISTMHLTTYGDARSRVAGAVGAALEYGTRAAERLRLGPFAGAGYLLRLVPYAIEEREHRGERVLVSDRDPVLDTLCYSRLYLPAGIARAARPTLHGLLTRAFGYPDAYVHLAVSPEIALSRLNGRRQLHENGRELALLQEAIGEELFQAECVGVPVVRIRTDVAPPREIAEEIALRLRRLHAPEPTAPMAV